MFQIVIIGPGEICRTYLEALKDSETVAVKAIAGRDTEKGRAMAANYGLPYYTDQNEMYKKENPDAVLICTPTYTHEEMVRRAIAHGVHVMCEKPFVLDSEIAKTLITEADAAGIKLMVMHVVRFWPEYRMIKQMIEAGELGEIKNVYFNRLSSHPTWASWHRDPQKSGGGLYDLHIHDIDFLFHVFGKVESVYAVGKQEETGCYNNVSTVLKFKNGISAVAEGFMDMTGAFAFTTNIRINGCAASVEMLNKQVFLASGETEKTDRLAVYRKDCSVEFPKVETYDPYALETEYFAECVQTDRSVEMVPNEDVVYVLEVLEAIQNSLETGKIILIS